MRLFTSDGREITGAARKAANHHFKAVVDSGEWEIGATCQGCGDSRLFEGCRSLDAIPDYVYCPMCGRFCGINEANTFLVKQCGTQSESVIPLEAALGIWAVSEILQAASRKG